MANKSLDCLLQEWIVNLYWAQKVRATSMLFAFKAADIINCAFLPVLSIPLLLLTYICSLYVLL